MKQSSTAHAIRSVVRTIGIVLAVAAVARELSKPKELRTWHGRIALVPYDFRVPTWQRVRRSVWAPDDPRVVTPHAFGVGWSLNLGRVVAIAKAAATRRRQDAGQPSS